MRLIGTTYGLAAVMAVALGAGSARAPPADEVTREQYDTWMTELSNWGRWGDDDQLDALNLITLAGCTRVR